MAIRWLSGYHFFWIEIPGEPDDQCTRGLGLAGTTVGPEWRRIDPSAGKWFAEMALELADNADVPTVITPEAEQRSPTGQTRFRRSEDDEQAA
jgi:hypothetical protein